MANGEDEAFYESSLSRIVRWIAVLGAGGTVLFAVFRDLHYAGGFLLGSAASWLSFWRWRKVAGRLGGETAPASSGRRAWRLALRLALIGAAVYVILKYLEVNLVAALLGLLAAAAAVVIELIYLLFHRGV